MPLVPDTTRIDHQRTAFTRLLACRQPENRHRPGATVRSRKAPVCKQPGTLLPGPRPARCDWPLNGFQLVILVFCQITQPGNIEHPLATITVARQHRMLPEDF